MSEQSEIERAFREESGRAVATLVRLFGDIDVAEEAVQDAFVVAATKWPTDGVPPNPGGWIVTTAKRKALDKLRGSDEPKTRMTLLDEKNKALDEEIRRLRAERRRLERDNPGTRQRD